MANTATFEDRADAVDAAVRELDDAVSARRTCLCGCPRGGFHTDDCLNALDAAHERRRHATDSYFGALREASFKELRRVEAMPYSRRSSDNAYSNWNAACEHLRVLEEVGPGLRLESEWLRVQAMEERYDMIRDAYLEKRAALTKAKKARRLKRVAVTDGRIRTGYKMVDGVRVPIVEATRMTFSDFILSRYCTRSARGDFIADAKTWIGARVFPPISEWSDLYRFLTRQKATDQTIDQARGLWRGFRKAVLNE